jgi:hypothetical protein
MPTAMESSQILKRREKAMNHAQQPAARVQSATDLCRNRQAASHDDTLSGSATCLPLDGVATIASVAASDDVPDLPLHVRGPINLFDKNVGLPVFVT